MSVAHADFRVDASQRPAESVTMFMFCLFVSLRVAYFECCLLPSFVLCNLQPQNLHAGRGHASRPCMSASATLEKRTGGTPSGRSGRFFNACTHVLENTASVPSGRGYFLSATLMMASMARSTSSSSTSRCVQARNNSPPLLYPAPTRTPCSSLSAAANSAFDTAHSGGRPK